MSDLVLYQFPGAFGLESLSPFCTKLGAYLRLCGIEYASKLGDPRKAPKGKLPYVAIDGALVGDSGIIIDRLKERHGDPLDGALSNREQAIAHLARRAAEEHLYWGLLQVRWDDDAIWNGGYRDTIAAMMPAAVRFFVPGLVRGTVRKSLRAHGLGRHSVAEIVAACTRDLDALVGLLEERAFVVSDAPSSADCSVYAMLVHLARTPGDHPLIDAVKSRAPLVEYIDRMDARIGWPTERAG